MPSRPSEQAEYLRVRWMMYLESVLAQGNVSRARLGDLLDVPASRVSAWLAGERGVEAGTAFSVGETLREQCGLETGGPDALFAAGQFTDLLRLLRAAAREDALDAREYAVALFCRLPRRFLRLELAALDAYPGLVEHYREDTFEEHEARCLRRDGAIGSGANPALEALERETDAFLASNAARGAFVRAWQVAQRPLDLVEVPRFPSRPATAMPGAFPSGARARVESAPSAPIHVPEVGPPPPDAIAALIEAIIALARALDRRNPTTTAPRLWRMLAEWAFAVEPVAFERFAPLLPATYAHFALER